MPGERVTVHLGRAHELLGSLGVGLPTGTVWVGLPTRRVGFGLPAGTGWYLAAAFVAILVVGQVGAVPLGSQPVGNENPGERTAETFGDWDVRAIHATAMPDPGVLETHATQPEATLERVPDSAYDDLPLVLVTLLGYNRYDDSDLLEHDVRREVYETVVESPAAYIEELADEAAIPVSTLRYHVRVLEREGLVTTDRINGHRRVSPVGTEHVELLAALNDDTTAPVVESVAGHEPVSVGGLAAALERAPSTVSYHLDRLEDAGALTRERVGESVFVSLTPDARARLPTEVTTEE